LILSSCALCVCLCECQSWLLHRCQIGIILDSNNSRDKVDNSNKDPGNLKLLLLPLIHLSIIIVIHPMTVRKTSTSLACFYRLTFCSRNTTWGKKSSSSISTNTGAATTLVNRATTPSSNTSRTNSPTPVSTTNAWTAKADERVATHSNDQLTHLLFTLTVRHPQNTCEHLPLIACRVNQLYCIHEVELRLPEFSHPSTSIQN